MKITKKYLRELIKQETRKLLQEQASQDISGWSLGVKSSMADLKKAKTFDDWRLATHNVFNSLSNNVALKRFILQVMKDAQTKQDATGA